MDKLEQVSENPELKQEMEAEVASTNSNQVIPLSRPNSHLSLEYKNVAIFSKLLSILSSILLTDENR